MSLSETESFGRMASLSDSLDGSPPFVIHGVAIGPNDITQGQTGKKKLWPAETLREAATSLKGRPLVRDHINTSRGVVGRVIDARWKPGSGVIYEAELDDEQLARKIANGHLEVSARIKHPPSEDLEVDEQSGAFVVDAALFDNLSIVPTGAAPSNEVDLGESDMLSAAELRAEFDYEQSEEDEISTPYEDNENYNVTELAQHTHHIPDWKGTSRSSWSAPRMGDFDIDDLERISKHFLVSTSGFPPENFNDLKLPVVDDSGFLNLRALRIAKRAVSQISGVDDEAQARTETMVNALIKSNFPRADVTASLEEVDEDWERPQVVEYLNEELDMDEVEELATHTPSYSSVATGRSWDGLNMEDFDTDDLSEIDDHFIVSDSGFPPDNFGDLGYEVVDTDGALVREAVNSAWGLRGQTEEDIENILLNLNDAFDDPPIDTEDSTQSAHGDEEEEENAEGEGDEEVDELDESDDETTYKRIVVEDEIR